MIIFNINSHHYTVRTLGTGNMCGYARWVQGPALGQSHTRGWMPYSRLTLSLGLHLGDVLDLCPKREHKAEGTFSLFPLPFSEILTEWDKWGRELDCWSIFPAVLLLLLLLLIPALFAYLYINSLAFWDRVLDSPGWPWTHYSVEVWLQLLFLLPPPPRLADLSPWALDANLIWFLLGLKHILASFLPRATYFPALESGVFIL